MAFARVTLSAMHHDEEPRWAMLGTQLALEFDLSGPARAALQAARDRTKFWEAVVNAVVEIATAADLDRFVIHVIGGQNARSRPSWLADFLAATPGRGAPPPPPLEFQPAS